MDLNDLPLSLSSPSSTNDSNVEYTFASPRPQNFSLPYPIIKYMFTNPSSGEAWKKLIMSCKYFFSKNSIFPVEYLANGDDNQWIADGEMFDSTKNIAKLWIYNSIFVFSHRTTLLSSLIPKIYKCHLSILTIIYQNLTFDEYGFLTSSGTVETLCLDFCTISHPDGTLVTFDRLFQKLHQLENFDMNCGENSSSMFKKNTVKRFAEILPRFKELSHFKILGLTEAFDFASITDFLLKNKTINVTLKYSNNTPMSDVYKEDLEMFISKIIEAPPKIVPSIDFPGLSNCIFFEDYQKLRGDLSYLL